MKYVTVDMMKITNWEDFHDRFSDTMGFPNFYGRNMSAWIDCMADLSSPDVVGMTKVQVPKGEHLVIVLKGTMDMDPVQVEIFKELSNAIAFVNDSKKDIPNSRKLLLLLS